MKNRHRFQPHPIEGMEDRLVMSTVSGLSLDTIQVQNTATKTLKVGALGDSLTDEYRFYAPDRSLARNWVEILSARRGVNFGAFSATKRAAPRNAGFANNWAQSGATTNDMVADQLPGLAQQVRRGQVNTVSILAGGDDFLDELTLLALQGSTTTDTASAINKVEANAENNMTTAVQTLLLANPNVNLVLFTLPDVTGLPAVKSALAFAGSSTILSQTSAAISTYNAHIESLAAGNSRVAVADLATQLNSLEQQAAATGSVDVGGTSLDTTTPSDAYNHLFLADGIHLGTIGQAAIANDFLQAIDTQFGGTIKPLTTTEVLRLAKHLPLR